LKVLMDSLSHRNDTAQLQKSTKTPAPDSTPRPVDVPVRKDTVRNPRIPRDKAE